MSLFTGCSTLFTVTGACTGRRHSQREKQLKEVFTKQQPASSIIRTDIFNNHFWNIWSPQWLFIMITACNIGRRFYLSWSVFSHKSLIIVQLIFIITDDTNFSWWLIQTLESYGCLLITSFIICKCRLLGLLETENHQCIYQWISQNLCEGCLIRKWSRYVDNIRNFVYASRQWKQPMEQLQKQRLLTERHLWERVNNLTSSREVSKKMYRWKIVALSALIRT